MKTTIIEEIRTFYMVNILNAEFFNATVKKKANAYRKRIWYELMRFAYATKGNKLNSI